MKILPLFAVLFLLLFSCSSQSDEAVKNSIFKECLKYKEIQLINKTVELFEKQVNKRYEANQYKRFLIEMKGFAIEPDFFLKSELIQYLLENKDSDAFKAFWQEEAGTFSIQVNGNYMNCLKQKSTSETLIEIINTLQKVPNISPGLVANTLEAEISEEDYNEDAIKTFIALNICAEFALNIHSRFNE